MNVARFVIANPPKQNVTAAPDFAHKTNDFYAILGKLTSEITHALKGAWETGRRQGLGNEPSRQRPFFALPRQHVDPGLRRVAGGGVADGEVVAALGE